MTHNVHAIEYNTQTNMLLRKYKLKAVVPMKNTKSYEYEADVSEFRKNEKRKRKQRQQSRDSKRSYNDGDE